MRADAIFDAALSTDAVILYVAPASTLSMFCCNPCEPPLPTVNTLVTPIAYCPPFTGVETICAVMPGVVVVQGAMLPVSKPPLTSRLHGSEVGVAVGGVPVITGVGVLVAEPHVR